MRAALRSTALTMGLLTIAPCGQLEAQLARPESPVRLQFAPCAAVVDARQLAKLARAELAPREVVLMETSARESPTVLVDACSTVVRLSAPTDEAHARPARTLSLDDVAEPVRARALALALAEFVRDSPSPTAAAPRPPSAAQARATVTHEPAAQEPASPSVREQTNLPTPRDAHVGPGKPARADAEQTAPAVAAMVEAEPRSTEGNATATVEDDPRATKGKLTSVPKKRPATRVGLRLAPELRTYFVPFSSLYGGQLSLLIGRFDLSAIALAGRQQQALGALSFGFAAASLGYELLQLGAHFALLAKLELGASWAQGKARTTAEGQAKTVMASSGAISALLRWPLTTNLRLETWLSGGVTYGLSARAGGIPVASTHGPFAALALALAYQRAP